MKKEVHPFRCDEETIAQVIKLASSKGYTLSGLIRYMLVQFVNGNIIIPLASGEYNRKYTRRE